MLAFGSPAFADGMVFHKKGQLLDEVNAVLQGAQDAIYHIGTGLFMFREKPLPIIDLTHTNLPDVVEQGGHPQFQAVAFQLFKDIQRMLPHRTLTSPNPTSLL